MEEEIIIGGAMKKLKVCLVLAVMAVMPFMFSDSIAQTFAGAESQPQVKISPRQKLVIELLKQELKTNKELSEDATSINEAIDESYGDDEIGPDCYTYTPLLVEA